MRTSKQRVATVARREFVATVTRPGFIATLILMPLLMGFIAVLPAVGIALSGGPSKILGLEEPGTVSVIGLVDQSGAGVVDPKHVAWHNQDQEQAAREQRTKPAEEETLGEQLPEFLRDRALLDRAQRGGFDDDWRLELRLVPDPEVGRDLVEADEASAVYVFGPDYLESGDVHVLLPPRGPMNPGIVPGQRAVARLVRRSLASPSIADAQVLERLQNVMNTEEEEVAPPGPAGGGEAANEGLEKGIAMLLPVLFASFFSLSIFVASGYLLDGIGEEKESRVLEVLLASLTPEELLAGKILGLGAAGLLQTSVLLLIGLVPMVAMGLFTMGVGTIAAMAACASLGYAEYASVMAASGAVAGNRQEGRQISAVFTLMASSPMFVLPVFLADPDGRVATVLSIFPATAPMAMTLRLGLGGVPAWQLASALVGMALAAVVSWRLGSRIFRVGILMTGARPPLRRVWEWVRAS